MPEPVSRASLIKTTSEFLCMSPARNAVRDANNNKSNSLVAGAGAGAGAGAAKANNPRTRKAWTKDPTQNQMTANATTAKDKENAEVPVAKISVFVRVRPMIQKETTLDTAFACTETNPPSQVLVKEFTEKANDYLRHHRLKTRSYTFDEVFGPDSSQQAVYQSCAAPLIDHIAAGGNATCFCYGATGAGKTHTMLGTREAPGVMVLTLQEIFERLGGAHGQHKIKLSYLEIYCEQVRDLLATDYRRANGPSASAASGATTARGTRGSNAAGLSLRARDQSSARGGVESVSASGLSVHDVNSAKDVLDLLHLGNSRRRTESTRSNDASSRSHAILQCYIPVVMPDGRAKMTKLSLIDLAGSERALATEGRSVRSTEGANINKSLLALSSCIHALCEGKRHIPFRNSKLTQLLRDSLGGAAKTVMIANVSPCSTQIGETTNTLHWANRAKEIRSVQVEETQFPAGVGIGPQAALASQANGVEMERLQQRVAELERSNEELAGQMRSMVAERDAALAQAEGLREHVVQVESALAQKRRRDDDEGMDVDDDEDMPRSAKRARDNTMPTTPSHALQLEDCTDEEDEAPLPQPQPQPHTQPHAQPQQSQLSRNQLQPLPQPQQQQQRRSHSGGGALRKLMCMMRQPPQSPAVEPGM